jgi:hypothetical protein
MNIQLNKEEISTLPQDPKSFHWFRFLALPFVLLSLFWGALANFDAPKFKSSFDDIVNSRFVVSSETNVACDDIIEAESCHGDWIRVRTSDGVLVWLPTKDVQIVFPPHDPWMGNTNAESVDTNPANHQEV